jgi:hypothetical protein
MAPVSGVGAPDRLQGDGLVKEPWIPAPSVVLSSEPAAAAPEVDPEVPVVLPGYVLPDDSLEEPTHGGS